MDIVQRLTEKYMKSSRGIILAVISARANYHIQKVLNIAQSFDVRHERVLSIVTQPDIPEAGSGEGETYVQFIKNEKVEMAIMSQCSHLAHRDYYLALYIEIYTALWLI
jgi:hypothetical protein